METKQDHAKELEFQDPELARELFGPQERNLDLLASTLQVQVHTRGTRAIVSGSDEDSVQTAARFLVQIYELLRSGHRLMAQDFEAGLRFVSQNPQANVRKLFSEQHFAVSPKKTINPRSATQSEYLQAIRSQELVFGIGPAGTGKTYLAVAMAVANLLEGKVERLILTRPALEAGEKLGFLPGDMAEKINPYLRPLYDALHEMLDFRRVQDMLETGIIEVAPLAFMRGRTLNKAFVILDEAQNTTPEQMKMFLTRIGFGSKAVVTGDITQIDLPPRVISGLIQAREVLAHIQDIHFVQFNEKDVMRHELVGKIVQAYAMHEEAKGSS
jgi:phosphate starvation-inducible PhoH-like protein